MTKNTSKSGAGKPAETRQERLEAALRANLGRRKAQARAQKAGKAAGDTQDKQKG